MNAAYPTWKLERYKWIFGKKIKIKPQSKAKSQIQKDLYNSWSSQFEVLEQLLIVTFYC